MIPVDWLAIKIAAAMFVLGAIVGAVVVSCFAGSGRASECERCDRVLNALAEARTKGYKAWIRPEHEASPPGSWRKARWVRCGRLPDGRPIMRHVRGETPCCSEPDAGPDCSRCPADDYGCTCDPQPDGSCGTYRKRMEAEHA